MLIPATYNEQKTEEYLTYFKGINKRINTDDGEIPNMRNLSSDNFPVLSTRKAREKTTSLLSPNGLGSKESLYWVDNLHFYYDGTAKGNISNNNKSFVNFNNWILIFPEKKYYDITTGDFKSLEVIKEEASAVFSESSITVTSTEGFKVGDGITIENCSNTANNQTLILKELTSTVLTFTQNSFSPGTFTNVTISRKIPDIDYVCEHQNRIWGCKGDNIYCSKLGDPTNFNIFEGTQLDSWATNTGTKGDFTGIASAVDRLIFMKETSIHELYGNTPETFSLSITGNLGCKKNCHKSIVTIGSYIYFYSLKGIMRYYSGNPELISLKLGDTEYTSAVAGSDYRRYYICLTDSNNITTLFVYDTYFDIWCIEDDFKAIQFTTLDGYLYAISSNGIYKFNTNGNVNDVEWNFETQIFTEVTHNKKLLNKFSIKADIDIANNGFIKGYVRKNDSSIWNEVKPYIDTEKKTYFYYLIPERLEKYQFKFTGKGQANIYSFKREILVRSDIK